MDSSNIEALNIEMDAFHSPVLVVCTTYNHVDYIDQALKSFLAQQTGFPLKILVHDDASTDGTDQIIRLYEKKYPEVIQGIYQSENQYSQGISISSLIQPYINSEYVALCEGDDWWIDSGKLQKQYEYLNTNYEIAGCVHAVKKIDATSGVTCGIIRPSLESKVFSVDDVIRGGGDMFGTNSLFFRTKFYLLEGIFDGWGVGDLPRFIMLASKGGLHYDPEIMSCYRVNTPGSWTRRMQEDFVSYETHVNQKIEHYYKYDEYSNKKYHKSIARRVRRDRFVLALKKVLYELKLFRRSHL